MFSRSIRIIVFSCIALVIATNFVLFFTAQDTTMNNFNKVVFIPFRNNASYEYRGFKYFYDYLSTFPGLANSHNLVSTVASIVTGEINLHPNDIINAVLSVLFVLYSILGLVFALVIDVVNNLVWLFQFFIPNFIS